MLADERELIAAELETAQTQARDSLSADQKRLGTTGRRQRGAEKANFVSRSAHSLRPHAVTQASPRVLPLRGNSCGNCDTAIPLQRRSIMSATG